MSSYIEIPIANAYRHVDRVCRHCGGVFRPSTVGQWYCTTEHQRAPKVGQRGKRLAKRREAYQVEKYARSTSANRVQRQRERAYPHAPLGKPLCACGSAWAYLVDEYGRTLEACYRCGVRHLLAQRRIVAVDSHSQRVGENRGSGPRNPRGQWAVEDPT